MANSKFEKSIRISSSRRARRSQRASRTLVLALICAFMGIWGLAGWPVPDIPAAGDVLEAQSPQGEEREAEESSADAFSAGLVPAYEGEASVTLNTTSGLAAENAPDSIVLPELDSLGRPGTVEMTVTADTLPAEGEERGSIGTVRPTGWHTVRDDSIDGHYLYNRCHLIAWCLSGLNAEPRNLITGTRCMNVEGMLPYETLVADHVEKSGGSVYYRVTPDFRGDDLVARGVRIQALSLDDGGHAVNLDVYCYNVQPAYEIDYATGEASPVS